MDFLKTNDKLRKMFKTEDSKAVKAVQSMMQAKRHFRTPEKRSVLQKNRLF